jgi:hypothetical protein
MLLGLGLCDPDMADLEIYNTEIVKLKATINNTSPAIQLGETLIIEATLPDTLISNTAKTFVQNLQEAGFEMKLQKFDTLNSSATLVSPPIYWTSIGSHTSFAFQFRTNPNPYKVKIHIKPQERGIYYLEVLTQPGKLRANNNSYRAGVVMGFEVNDPHLDILLPYSGFDVIVATMYEQIARGVGYYAFRVE